MIAGLVGVRCLAQGHVVAYLGRILVDAFVRSTTATAR